MLPQTVEELDELLISLRAIGGDHQWVEVKRARDELPRDMWTSLSALAMYAPNKLPRYSQH